MPLPERSMTRVPEMSAVSKDHCPTAPTFPAGGLSVIFTLADLVLSA